jgi:hypothetical protein
VCSDEVVDPDSIAPPFQQFQTTPNGAGGPKWVVGAIVFVILIMFIGMIGLAVVSNS